MLSALGALEIICHFRSIATFTVAAKPGSCSNRHRDVSNKSQKTPGLEVIGIALCEEDRELDAVPCRKSKSYRMCKFCHESRLKHVESRTIFRIRTSYEASDFV